MDWGPTSVISRSDAPNGPLMAFVMVLSHSRRVFLRFFLDARMDAFLDRPMFGRSRRFGAVCKDSSLYDNLKSAVSRAPGRGDPVQPRPSGPRQPIIGFEPRPGRRPPAATRRVGSSATIRYIRDNFFARPRRSRGSTI